EVLHQTGLDPRRLDLEITESDVFNENTRSLEILSQLREQGIQISIDDFGTGNTSLSWLEKLRPDVLKIDRSFTSSVGIDSVNATVTDIIIALANRLHIVTVAEGVDTLEQESYLRSHGVDVLQGFYYARPMPVRRSRRGWPAGRRVRVRARRQNNSPAAAAGEPGDYSSSSLGGRVTTARTRSTR
ncbi:EAL domain-containing protein, partial [Acinetobacter baumannii]|uniref:EAL domain-containing protein n=1 Tax=Acinetobacter baumannii TaxID=470 RepID=UPI0018DC70E3